MIAANVPHVGADGRETITCWLLVKSVTQNRRGLFQSAGDRERKNWKLAPLKFWHGRFVRILWNQPILKSTGAIILKHTHLYTYQYHTALKAHFFFFKKITAERHAYKRMYSTATAQPKFKLRAWPISCSGSLTLSQGTTVRSFFYPKIMPGRRGARSHNKRSRSRGSNLWHKARSKEWATRT